MFKLIQEMSKTMQKLSHIFTDESCVDFRLSPYLVSEKTEGGLLLFPTLTCALIHIDGVFSVNELCKKVQEDPELRKALLSTRVLIPEGFDEQKFCEQLRTMLLNEKKRLLHGRKNSYIIFTTTACNARCYYCFEHGYAPVTMNDETALKTAEYMKNHTDGELTITWFGGEPLVNTRAIDLITGDLTENGFHFKSHIVTNAYLFSPELIKKAKENWHLVSAQITLDGTKENYNRIKNYVNSDIDAYSRVLSNIKELSDNDIQVLLYLTLSRENESDIYTLLRELEPMIKAKKNYFSVMPSLLMQYGGTPKEDEMQKKLIQMKRWLRENGLTGEPSLPQDMPLNSCTADHPGMAVIQPDGGLNCCDHIGICEPYGSVFHEEIDQSRVNWWAMRKDPIEKCDGCALYPQCLRLKNCEAKKFNCTEITRAEQLSDLVSAMKTAYQRTMEDD